MGDYRNPEDAHMARPIQVIVRYTGDSKEERDKCLEKAISQFKKIIMKEGLMNELKERESFQSPGRKRYLQRQKFYYRLNQKKEKEAHSYKKKGGYDDKKQNYNNNGKSNYEPRYNNKPRTNNAPNRNPVRQAVNPPVHR